MMKFDEIFTSVRSQSWLITPNNHYSLGAGLETGTIQHVPSTQDLLAAQGLDAAGFRRSVSQIAANFSLEADAMGSKRGSVANLLSHFNLDPEDDSASQSDSWSDSGA